MIQTPNIPVFCPAGCRTSSCQQTIKDEEQNLHELSGNKETGKNETNSIRLMWNIEYFPLSVINDKIRITLYLRLFLLSTLTKKEAGWEVFTPTVKT